MQTASERMLERIVTTINSFEKKLNDLEIKFNSKESAPLQASAKKKQRVHSNIPMSASRAENFPQHPFVNNFTPALIDHLSPRNMQFASNNSISTPPCANNMIPQQLIQSPYAFGCQSMMVDRNAVMLAYYKDQWRDSQRQLFEAALNRF